jgi:ketosteroid isomerase-like protein
MSRPRVCPKLFLPVCLSLCLSAVVVDAQRQRGGSPGANASSAESRLTGVYRLNAEQSDRLYSVVSSASSNVPFGDQQRFFIDLTARLTPPDQLAIRRQGRVIDIASSRAPRTTFSADGRDRVERNPQGILRERAAVVGESFVLSSENSAGESYTATFTPFDGGSRLRVTRRIASRELNQPVVIRSVYDRISDVARWEIYGESRRGTAAGTESAASSVAAEPAGHREELEQANALRASLNRWVEATNEKDIRRQMDFYVPTLLAYYLTRNTPRDAVRAEKARVFAGASVVAVSAEEPEIVFLPGGRAAVMRFRKRYRIEGGREGRRGEVIQELRWRQTDGIWKIYSERDIRVIR